MSADIAETFLLNWETPRPGALYVVEDLSCTHDRNYPKVIGSQHSPERFERSHFIKMIDNLLRHMDAKSGEVEFVHFYPGIAFIKKASGPQK